MTSAKDGCAAFAMKSPWTGRSGLHRVPARVIPFCLLVLPVGVATDVLGTGHPVTSTMMPAVRVVANQAMSLTDDPAPPASGTGRTAAANRPVSLTALVDEPRDETAAEQAAVGGEFLLANAAQPGGSAGPQDLAQGEDDMIASINFESERAMQISVAQDSTITIKLKKPIDRAEIMNPDIADVVEISPMRLIVRGVSYGTTQLVLRSGQEERVFNVSVELDLAMLRGLIRAVSPTANVELRSVNGTIVLRGSVPSTEAAEQIAELAALVQGGEVRNQMKVTGVQQTMLRVVVAEVNREAIRRLGINWSIGASDWSRDFFLANNVGLLNPTVFGSSGIADVLTGQQLYSVAPIANTATTNLTFGFPRAEFQVFLNALRENSLARTLAEPNLVAFSGQTASFLAGGEVPLSVVSSSGGQSTISIMYKEFGVLLGFTPTIMGGQVIRLHVMSEVSEPVPQTATVGGLPVFAFNTRRVETTIECGNGQTFAIAGLLSEEVQAIASKIPGLGDLPILGTLFSSTSYQKSVTEMIVLVTPQLVEPLDPQQVPPPPGSLMTDPSDLELFGLQKLEGTPKTLELSESVPRERAPVNVRPVEATSWSTSQLALRGPWGLADFVD